MGYPAGTRDQNRPLFFCDHRMGGYKATLDNSQWRHSNWVGVHFGLGRDGSISQYTNIFDASWGNGVSKDQWIDRTNRHLADIEHLGIWHQVVLGGEWYWTLDAGGVNVFNSHSISIEHEDEVIDQPWTPAMIAADIKVKKWCIEELNRYGWAMVVDSDILVGHFQIDRVNRAGCPGVNWPRAAILAAIGGRMYTDAQIDAKIGESLALGVRLQTSVDNLKNAVTDLTGLVKTLMQASALPEDQENARLKQINDYLEAIEAAKEG